jgi:hypothetical protein
MQNISDNSFRVVEVLNDSGNVRYEVQKYSEYLKIWRFANLFISKRDAIKYCDFYNKYPNGKVIYP